jgi:arylsulfatase A-like enzyme
MPHDPNVAPSPYYENVDMSRIKADASLPCDAAYLNDISKSVSAHAGNAFLTEFLRIYHAALKLVDDQIGRLLGALEKRGIADNTVIIFTADHGDMAGGHGMFWKSTRAFYEEVARVPLIISAPGYNKNTRYTKLVELVDIMPTILDLCGIKTQTLENIDGVSLVPVLSGGESSKDTALCERLGFGPGNKRYPHTNDKNYNFMLRGGRFKYVVHHNEREHIELLFDLENDPNEYENLICQTEYKGTAGAMREKLRLHLQNSGGFMI